MKIMHLTSVDDGGGEKAHILGLLEELSRKNEVELVCFEEGPFSREARQRSINTRVLKKRSDFHIARNLKKYLKNMGFDLLHSHGARADKVASLLAGAGCPVLSTVHEDPGDQTPADRFDDWVTVSGALKERLALRGWDAGRIFTIHNGIDFPKKLPHLPRQEFLRSLGLDWNGEHVIYGIAARMDPVGDMETLIRAFAMALRSAPNARLLIAGTGEQEQQLRALAEELCPAGTVCFAGAVTDRNSFYHALDVNLLTSTFETIPCTILEGARMRCATICTNVGGLPGVVIDGQTGFLAEPGDVQMLALRMTDLAQDAPLRAKLGGAIYDKVKAEFNFQTMAQRQMEIYRSVLNRKTRTEQGRYGAMICGAYGKKNAGDDAILMCMIRQLRQQDPDLPITVLSHDPRQTAALTGVSTEHVFNIPAVIRRMRRCKLYISGGGSLIQNATSNRSLLYYLYSIRLAKRLGCKVMMYGCGIGPVNGEKSRDLTARILEENVDLITLRDRGSRETLESMGVRSPGIHVTADPAMGMEEDPEAARKLLRRSGLDPEGRYCLFVLRPWEGTEEKLPAICAAADHCWEKYGLMPLFYTLEPGRDDGITRAAAELVKAPSRVLEPELDGPGLCGLMGRMELVVSMRLHALIFASARQTRVAAISYDPKVSGFMDWLDSGSCLELPDVTEEDMKAVIDRALSGTEQLRNVAQLKALAEQNGILAGELLRS